MLKAVERRGQRLACGDCFSAWNIQHSPLESLSMCQETNQALLKRIQVGAEVTCSSRVHQPAGFRSLSTECQPEFEAIGFESHRHADRRFKSEPRSRRWGRPRGKVDQCTGGQAYAGAAAGRGGVLSGPILVRIDTNQGIAGYGEMYNGGISPYALMLKSRLLGESL
jgi:hypothetical protein